MKKELKIMDNIMGAIVDSEEWGYIQLNDPQIQMAKNALKELLEQIRPLVPTGVADSLYDACLSVVTAYSDAAIIHGIHVSNSIHMVAADPTALSRYVAERMEAR